MTKPDHKPVTVKEELEGWRLAFKVLSKEHLKALGLIDKLEAELDLVKAELARKA